MIDVSTLAFLKGKKALVTGIANDQSIAWGCAKAFQAFGAKVYAPEAAAQIAADEEKFLDKSKLSIVMLGEVIETTK